MKTNEDNRYFYFFLCLFVTCFFPKIQGFSDESIRPKWFLCLFLLSISGCCFCVQRFISLRLTEDSRRRCIDTGRLKVDFCRAFIFVSSIESFYVIYKVIIEQKYIGCIGTFDTPGALALCLCLSLPFCFYLFLSENNKYYRILVFICVTVIVIALFLTKSRSGWMCLFVYVFFWINRRLRKLPIFLFCSLGICILFMVFILWFKEDSTDGRMFILERSWDLIKKNPIIGYGYGHFNYEYMKNQAEFFLFHENSKFSWLADDIRHPLNEFVLVWIEFGVLGVLLLVSAFVYIGVISLRYDDIFFRMVFLSMCSILIFSLFFYPFTYPLTWLLFVSYLLFFSYDKWLKYNIHENIIYGLGFVFSVVILLRICIEYRYEYEWSLAMRKSIRGYSKEMMPLYDRLYMYYQDNPYFLYNYAVEQFYAERYDGALNTAKECMSYWSSYNLSLLTGDICRWDRNLDEAITYYLPARFMCPVRFAPLEGLYYSYVMKNDLYNADSIANIIFCKDVKVYSYEVYRIKNEVRRNFEQRKKN